MILFAVMVASAYVVTPGRDYHPACSTSRDGFSQFYSDNPKTSIALMPGYSSHFVPVKHCGKKHAFDETITLPYDTDYQAAVEDRASTQELLICLVCWCFFAEQAVVQLCLHFVIHLMQPHTNSSLTPASMLFPLRWCGSKTADHCARALKISRTET